MTAAGWDEGRIFARDADSEQFVEKTPTIESDTLTRAKFAKFIKEFRDGNSYVYSNKLLQNVNLKQYFLKVNLDDLRAFDEELADSLMSNPADLVAIFEAAAKDIAMVDAGPNIPDIQILFLSTADPTSIRGLKSNHIRRLVKVPGIIISASKLQAKATSVTVECRQCHVSRDIPVKYGFSGIQMGINICSPDTKCPPNSLYIIADRCKYVDQQTLKLQEAPEAVPTGEMPRHILLTVDRSLVGLAVPGTRVEVIGLYTVFNDAKKQASVKHAYMRVMGLEDTTNTGGRSSVRFTPQEEREFRKLAREPDLYDRITKNIAPAIFGHEDIKKAISCQLFGGAAKKLPDKMTLRGDINVLLLGDPGTAKSQLLKFTEKVAPIGVYTSGKGSSAAGLTASVVRDTASREFYLEGGAMVLADGGIVCIDEFDKMNPDDRVAIHEAMEQQTISIAKAGITTILNSRTAVLAAANPVFGRYDELRDASENIDFQTTILSRFDLIFIVKDARSPERDRQIAEHVVALHMTGSTAPNTEMGDLTLEVLKRYIAFCRSRCSPRLSPDAAQVLQNYYVNIRAQVRQREIEGASNAVPITVRQLEAIVRLSESLAKMTLSNSATEQHVNEAIRLFNISTFDAITAGVVQSEYMSPQLQAEVQTVEKVLKRRLPIGSAFSEMQIVKDLVKQGMTEHSIRKAIDVMVRRDELEYHNQRRKIYRKR